MRKILVLGANSTMAQSAIRNFAREGHAFFLVGRNPDKLDSLVSDLKSRGVRHVEFMTADFNDLARHSQILEKAGRSMGGYDTVLLAYGENGNSEETFHNVGAALHIFQTDLLGPISLLTLIAEEFEKKARLAAPGTCYSIGVVTSAAGDQGQGQNYIYGAARGGLSLFLEGLADRLGKVGVEVLDFKPAFTNDDLTSKSLKMGRKVALSYGRGSGVYYLPWYGRLLSLKNRYVPKKLLPHASP